MPVSEPFEETSFADRRDAIQTATADLLDAVASDGSVPDVVKLQYVTAGTYAVSITARGEEDAVEFTVAR
jgi:hypothetical protein